MPPKITLTYFDMRGRAEVVRLALFLGDIPFEDKRVNHSDLAALKPKLKFGQLPVIEVDGEEFAQSHAMARYAGHLSGLYPKDPLKALRVDEILGAIEDTISHVTPSMRVEDKSQVEPMRKAVLANQWPTVLRPLEKMLEASKSGYIVNEELSIADLFLYTMVDWYTSGTLDHIHAEYFDSYPKLKAHRDMIANIPKVAEWNKAHNH